ncbi:hypothetical protein GGR58DRAFT_512811 [Xylaria digitata]|nr:hypothetical protein GGR58DRAFT_512811 [Xylaria digitata]
MGVEHDTSLYPKYKKDTKAVAQWLDVTSKAYGFVSSRGQRLQAEAKKRNTICIADFRLMAEFLSRTPHVSIPSYVLTSLSRAIRYRSTYGSYLQAQRQNKTEDSKHLYFIDVLRNVQKALSRIPKLSAPVATVTQTALTVNKFARLYIAQPATVEDDIEDDTPTPIPIHTKASSQPLKDDVNFDPSQEDFEEALFQWRLFNIDMKHIRMQIRQLWEMYRMGHLGLAGVATAHNMALHLVRKLEKDFQPTFKRWGGYQRFLLTNFIRRYCGAAANDEEMKMRLDRFRSEEGEWIEPQADVIINEFDIAEEEMAHAWQILYKETLDWEQSGAFGYHDDEWGHIVPSDDRQNKTSYEKYSQDKAVACKVLYEVYIMAMYLNPHIGMTLDELSTAIEDVVPWKPQDLVNQTLINFPLPKDEANFRSVFAVQLFLDSTHVLGTSIDRPCRELMDKNARIHKSAKNLREFYKKRRVAALGLRRPLASRAWEVEIKTRIWVEGDLITVFKDHQSSPDKKACSMLKHNPPFCGWWMQTVQATNYPCSIDIAKSMAVPLYCARLYSVFLQERLIPKGSWPDMDAFITLHRGDLWVGTTPKPGHYLRSLILAGGGSIVSLASDVRPGPTHSSRPAKTITPGAKVSMNINEAFVRRKAEGLTQDDLDRLISGTKLRWYDGKPVKPCFHHGWDKAGNHKGDMNFTSSETDNPFLRLAQAVDAENLEMSFDYMLWGRVCWLVLQELRKKGRPILDTLISPSRTIEPIWEGTEGLDAIFIVRNIFLLLFPPEDDVRREEASAIADILLSTTRNLGRVVHASTGIDWEQALKCTCADIPPPNGSLS